MKFWSSWISGRNRTLKSLLLNLSLILLVIFFGEMWNTRNLLPKGSQVPIENFNLQGLDGKIYELHQNKGGVFLYFFTTWCFVCRINISNLNDLPVSKEQKKINVYAVVLDWKDVDEVKNYINTQNLDVPVLLGLNEIARKFRIQAFPTYYVLNDKKNVIHRSVGYSTSLGMLWNYSKMYKEDFGFHFFSFLFDYI